MTQALKRGLFGYRRSSVKKVLADREEMFERVTTDARESDERAREVAEQLETSEAARTTAESEVETVRGELETVRTELETVRGELGALSAELESSRAALESLGGELHTVRTERDAARTELSSMRATVQDRERRIDELEGSLRTIQEQPPAEAEASAPLLPPGDLNEALRQTEHAIQRIVEKARIGAEQEVAEVERHRDAVRAELEALIAKRDRLTPLARNVRELLGEAQARTEEAETRLRTALEPLTRTVGVLQQRLTELMAEADEDEPSVEISDEPTPAEGSTDVIRLAEAPRTARSPW